MPTPQIFNPFKANVANGVHDLWNDDLKLALTNIAPVLTDAQFADLNEITAGNGYNSGGFAIGVGSSMQSGGVYSLGLNALSFAASGGDMAEFRYLVLYNSTAAGSPLICFYDHGAAVTLTDGGAPYAINAAVWLSNA